MVKKSDPIRGRCLCGAVQFQLTPPTDFCAHCHCRSCRLAHGAAFVTWTSVPLDRFSFVAGEDGVRWHRSSEWIEWGFCGRCGSSMLYRADRGGHPESPRLDRMYVAVGSLIDALDREPANHVSYEERVAWLGFHDDLPKRRGKTEETLPE
jgi:hypothetical protein